MIKLDGLELCFEGKHSILISGSKKEVEEEHDRLRRLKEIADGLDRFEADVLSSGSNQLPDFVVIHLKPKQEPNV